MEAIMVILGFIDGTILLILDQPVLRVFLVGLLMLAVLGLVILLKEAAGGKRWHRR